jgi:hypothetical protein
LRLLSGAAAAVEEGAEEGFSALSFSVVDVVTTVARAPGAAVDGLTMGSSSESEPDAVVGIHAQGTLGDHHGRRGEDHDARAGSKWLTIRSRAG